MAIKTIQQNQLKMVDIESSVDIDIDITKHFITLCLSKNHEDPIDYLRFHHGIINANHNNEEAFRNACMVGNLELMKILHSEYEVNYKIYNHQCFHLACLAQNIDIVNWFRDIDRNYKCTFTEDNLVVPLSDHYGYSKFLKAEPECEDSPDISDSQILSDCPNSPESPESPEFLESESQNINEPMSDSDMDEMIHKFEALVGFSEITKNFKQIIDENSEQIIAGFEQIMDDSDNKKCDKNFNDKNEDLYEDREDHHDHNDQYPDIENDNSNNKYQYSEYFHSEYFDDDLKNPYDSDDGHMFYDDGYESTDSVS